MVLYWCRNALKADELGIKVVFFTVSRAERRIYGKKTYQLMGGRGYPEEVRCKHKIVKAEEPK